MYNTCHPTPLLLRSRHRLIPILPRLLHRRPLIQLLVPLPRNRILLFELLDKALTHDVRRLRQQPMPRHESQIRIGALVADEILAAGFLEVCVNHAEDTMDLVTVALEAGVDFVLVVEDEPGALAEVGACNRSAIGPPLLSNPFIR